MKLICCKVTVYKWKTETFLLNKFVCSMYENRSDDI